MDWQRTLLGGGILVVLLMLLVEWNTAQQQYREQHSSPVSGPTLPSLPEADAGAAPVVEVPDSDAAASPASDIPVVESETPLPASPSVKRQLVTVHTDSLNVMIDTLGGDIVHVSLPKHLAKLAGKGEAEEPFILLNRIDDPANKFTYIAQSGLVGANGTDKADGSRPTFKAAKSSYTLGEGEDSLSVDLVYQTAEAEITKRFTFKHDSYLVELDYLIENRSSSQWQGNLYGQIKRDSSAVQTSEGAMGIKPFLGAALTTTDDRYKKVNFADLAEDGPIRANVEGGWVALVQHYFISAWVPDQQLENNFNLRSRSSAADGTMNLIGFTSPAITVAPGETGTLKASFYAGPKDTEKLEEISPYLDLTVDYGWLWWVAKPIFAFLKFIQSLVSNWGLSIILLTVAIKAAFYPLSAASYKSMAKMRKLTPKLNAMREQFGDDRQKMSAEMMKLYQKEKVNPMGGCLPVLIQMPVFIALYWVLMESVELRHTAFLYIDDLSVKDPYFILPLIMGATMFFQQRLNPMPPDPTQAAIMKWMPVMFTFFFLWFPAGLVVYWVVNNLLSITQQWYVTKQIEAA